MGLDITAYSKMQYVGRHEVPDGEEEYACEHDESTFERLHVKAFAYNSFPHALAGLPDGEVQAEEVYGSDDFILAGCFAVTDETKTEYLAAGSYGGYSRFREMLRLCFTDSEKHITEQPEAPFFELIWFADNEGTLLAKACTDLLADFEAGREQWQRYVGEQSENTYYLRKYYEWTAALQVAADGGLLDFH